MNTDPPLLQPEAPGDQPMTAWHCHMCDRGKARKIIARLAACMPTPSEQRELEGLPLDSRPGVVRNHLYAMSGAQPMFAIDMRNGEVVAIEGLYEK